MELFAVATVVALLAVAMIGFTYLFLVFSFRGEDLSIRTDLGAFGGGFGGWQFSRVLAYLLAAMLFGACFTFAANQLKEVVKKDSPPGAGGPGPAKGAARDSAEALRVIKRSALGVDRRLQRTARKAAEVATAANEAAAAAKQAAKMAQQASDDAKTAAEGATKAATAASACRSQRTAITPTPVRSCNCIDGERQPGNVTR